MISLEKVLKEILPIYSRYMVCYTLDEQNEIINESMGVIDINDKRRLIKNEIDTCKICKLNPRILKYVQNATFNYSQEIYANIITRNVKYGTSYKQ